MDPMDRINVEAESEPEDGEILDEVEEEEEEEERVPASGRRGHSRRERERRHKYGQVQDFRRRNQHHHHHHHHEKYNNRSERSGGISRTLEYVRYLKSFTERNKSISAKRSSLPEERSSGNRKSRSRSQSPRHSDRHKYHQSRKEIKSYTERCEGKSKSRSSSSTGSREETCQDDVVNGLGDIEEVSTDEMQAISPSSVSSVDVVRKVSCTKTPEIITLDSTDTSDEENPNLAESKTAAQETAEDGLISNANPADDSDVTDLEGTGVEIVEGSGRVLSSLIHELDTETRDSGFMNVNQNPSNLQTLVESAIEEHEGYTVEEIELDENIGEEISNDSVDVEVVVLGGNVPEDEEIEDRTNVGEIFDENIIDDDVPVFAGNIAEDEDLDQNHLSDEEIDVLVLRNQLLADLVNKTDSTSLASPSSPMAQFPHSEKEPESTNTHINDENVDLQKNVDSGNNDEAEALRAVLLSLYLPTSGKSNPTEPLCDNDINTIKPTATENSSSKPKPIAKRRSTDDERRSSINRRRTSNPNPYVSSKSRPHSSPPRRKPLPVKYRRNSVGNRRYSKDFDRRRSRSRERERSRKSPSRSRDVDDRKTSRAATLSPPLSNKSSEHTSLSNRTVKQTPLLSRTSYHKNDSPIVNIKELSQNDLRVKLLKHSGLQKKTSIGLTSPNSDPIFPIPSIKFMQNESQIEKEMNEVTIRRTVSFVNPVKNHVTILSPATETWDYPITTLSSNISLPQEHRYEIPHTTFPSVLSVSGQPLQKTAFAAPPNFPNYLLSTPTGLEQSLINQLQPTGMGLSRPSFISANVSNSCGILTEAPDLHHSFDQTGMKVAGNLLKKPRRRVRKKADALPNPWDQLPNNTETNQTAVNIPTLSSISSRPLKGTAKLNIIKPLALSTPKPIHIAPVFGSPLLKTAVVNQANILTNTSNTVQQMGASKQLQKSSPYSSPVLSPTMMNPTKRLIIPVRDGDSTSDEMEEDTETPSFPEDSNAAGNGEALGNDFQKSLDEFLKSTRDKVERKTNEILAHGQGIRENSGNLEVQTDTIPSPLSLSSAIVVKKASNAVSEVPVSDPAIMPQTSQPNEAHLKELSDLASATTNPANPTLELSKLQSSGPSPAKKRRLLSSNLNNTKANPTAENQGSETAETITPVEVSVPTPKKTAETSVTATASKSIHMQTGRADHQPMPRKVPIQGSRPISAEILNKQNTTVIATSKITDPVNGISNIGKSTLPLKKASPMKKLTLSNSGLGSENIAARVVPGHTSLPYSKQMIDDLTKKIVESKDQLALSSKEKELLHCRQSCVDGLRVIYKGLTQHSRLYIMDSKIQSEIAAAEKHLQELRKKQLDVRIKASTLNKAIKEKSKLVLPIKANCITLEREVKKLGDKIMGDRFYKVTDLFTKDIDSFVKDITGIHKRQPTNLKLERGVIFHQVISDIDPTSTIEKRNVSTTQKQGPPAITPRTLVATKTPAKPQRKLDANTKSAENSSGTSGKETDAKNNVQQQQTSHGKKTVQKKANSHKEIRFLTKHGRGPEEETPDESVSPSRNVLTDIKSSGTERIVDMELPILLLLPGAFTIRLDPHVQLCPESLLNNVCLKTDCEFQHI